MVYPYLWIIKVGKVSPTYKMFLIKVALACGDYRLYLYAYIMFLIVT